MNVHVSQGLEKSNYPRVLLEYKGLFYTSKGLFGYRSFFESICWRILPEFTRKSIVASKKRQSFQLLLTLGDLWQSLWGWWIHKFQHVRMAERSKAPDSSVNLLCSNGVSNERSGPLWGRGFESHFWQEFIFVE